MLVFPLIILISLALLSVVGGFMFFGIYKLLNKQKPKKNVDIYEDDSTIEEEKRILKKLQDDYIERLSAISHLDEKSIKDELYEEIKDKYGREILNWKRQKIAQTKSEIDHESKNIIGLAIQRNSSKVTNEFTVINIELKDEIEKSKLIGKEGRNIQYFEKLTGVEIIIDRNDLLISLSGFDSVNKFIAKKTIEKLLEDGRIHPGKIKEFYEKSKLDIEEDILESGKRAVENLGINDFPIELIKLIGRLKYRTSYGQNILNHSIEVATLSKSIAAQINEKFGKNTVDVDITMKGGLLHDIGKSIDEKTNHKTNHVSLGEQICDDFGLDWRIKKCISSHHNENYFDEKNGFCIEAVIADSADGISGSRKGARKGEEGDYRNRMEQLNKNIEGIYGVSKSWVMKGGREIWVFFDTTKINAYQLSEITSEIAKKIENIDGFGGEIKIVGKWENEFIVDLH